MILLNDQLQSHLNDGENSESGDELDENSSNTSSPPLHGSESVRLRYTGRDSDIDGDGCGEHLIASSVLRKAASAKQQFITSTRTRFDYFLTTTRVAGLIIEIFFTEKEDLSSTIIFRDGVVIVFLFLLMKQSSLIATIVIILLLLGKNGILIHNYDHQCNHEHEKVHDLFEEKDHDRTPQSGPDEVNNMLHEVHRQRRKIQNALASIQAPPLALSLNEYKKNQIQGDFENLYYAQLVELTKSHVKLLRTVERSIGMIRMACSIHFGLGPSSPAVERVEDSSCLVEKSDANQNEMDHRGGKFYAQKMRLALFRAMDLQHASLCTVWDTIALKDYNEDAGIYEIAKESNLLTLSVLKSCKRQTGQLLSKVLSSGFDYDISDESTAILGHEHGHQELLLNRIKSSIHHADEQEAYLTTCFSTLSTSVENDKRLNGMKAAKVFHHFYQLRQHINASNVMLWLFMHSFQEKYDVSDDVAETGAEIDTELDSIWGNLSKSLQNVLMYRQSLEQILFPDHGTRSGEVEKEISFDEDTALEKIDRIQYDDEGKEILITSKETVDPRWKGKTIVFSGKGSKTTRPLKSKRPKDISNLPDMTQINMFHETTGRVALLRELQSRIDTIEFAEEIEVAVLKDSDDVLDHNEGGGDRKKTVSKDFFMGVSGDILSELKNAITESTSEI